MPSNAVRGFLVEAIQSLTEKPGVKYAVWGTFALNIFYFWCARRRRRPAQESPLLTPRQIYGARRYTMEGLMHMGRDLGILSPVAYAITCEAKQDMFRQERNALICGASLFLWFVLRRLVDIQGKLHESRAMHKAAGGAPKGGVPMGMPVGQPAKPLKGE